jgi:hypothetical protein
MCKPDSITSKIEAEKKLKGRPVLHGGLWPKNGVPLFN